MPDTTLTSAELDELERLAKAATPGKWFPGYWSGVCRKPEHQGNHPGKNGDNPCVYEPELVNCNRGVAAEIGVDVVGSDYDGAVMSDENVDYIATANPATILRLLSLARAGLEAGKAEESMRERAAELADSEAALRKENGVAAEAGDTRWGLDTEAASLAQYHKSVTDLANCPFCGDAPVIRRTMQDYPADDVHPAGQYEAAVHVCCVTCGFELVEEYQSEVIAAWNRRATTRTSEAEPVAWRVKDYADGWILIHDKHQAHECAKAMGSLIEPLYTLYTLPTPASDNQVEAVTDEMVERAALALAKRNHVPQWREFIPDARAALLAAMGSTKP